jgi:hypothetical protein
VINDRFEEVTPLSIWWTLDVKSYFVWVLIFLLMSYNYKYTTFLHVQQYSWNILYLISK